MRNSVALGFSLRKEKAKSKGGWTEKNTLRVETEESGSERAIWRREVVVAGRRDGGAANGS